MYRIFHLQCFTHSIIYHTYSFENFSFNICQHIMFNVPTIVNDRESHRVHTFIVPRHCSIVAWWCLCTAETCFQNTKILSIIKVLKYNYSSRSRSSSSSSSSDKKNLKSNLIKLQNHINNPTEKINTYTCIILHKFQNQQSIY